ncbi:MAG: nucleotidyltransferase family protein [Gammaproteobacteria bacterium]|nr:MAG: nucleotidyltransferase family protein [Gammaproteobacteria bacterium]
MKAMLLAAGLGTRMRPLTDRLPKPLIEVQGKPLLHHHLENLARAGFTEVVINHSRLGGMIEDYCGDGAQYGLRIRYSREGDEPLDIGGGILNALNLLGSGPFLVVSADLYTDFDFARLRGRDVDLAHFVLVDNPAFHPVGDFHLDGSRVSLTAGLRLTYGGIGVFSPAFFEGCRERVFPILPLLCQAVAKGQVTGEHFTGTWVNVGTPEQLAELNR